MSVQAPHSSELYIALSNALAQAHQIQTRQAQHQDTLDGELERGSHHSPSIREFLEFMLEGRIAPLLTGQTQLINAVQGEFEKLSEGEKGRIRPQLETIRANQSRLCERLSIQMHLVKGRTPTANVA